MNNTDDTQDDRLGDSLDSLAEWSRWLIGVGVVATGGCLAVLVHDPKPKILCAVFWFLLSIGFAAILGLVVAWLKAVQLTIARKEVCIVWVLAIVQFVLLILGAWNFYGWAKKSIRTETSCKSNTEQLKAPSEENTQSDSARNSLTSILKSVTKEETIQRIGAHLVPCVEGPSDKRMAVLLVDPKQAIRTGAMWFFVPAFTAYKPAPDPPRNPNASPNQSSYIFSVGMPDHARMEIEEVGVYTIEEKGNGKHRLALEGVVDFLEYGRFLRLDPTDDLKSEPTDFIDIQTRGGGKRRLPVFQTKCVDGPASGKMFPLLVDPSTLFQNGLTTVAVTELSTRPLEDRVLVGRPNVRRNNFIGHCSLYVLEQIRKDQTLLTGRVGFHLRFVSSFDAIEYLAVHNPRKGVRTIYGGP